LLALKVLVGMTLLGFAYKRYASMEEREKMDDEKDKEMQEMNKPEEVRGGEHCGRSHGDLPYLSISLIRNTNNN
jgi:hypothetical protein